MDSTEAAHAESILSFLAEGGDDFISGAALSDKLGLSRAAVWKYVEQLRGLGYRIDAQANRGYRLVEIPDRLTALELSPLLATRELGRRVYFEESVDSTNARAFDLAKEGAAHGDVFVAEAQTAGRGRRGRTWFSPPGKNLTFSVVLRPEVPPARAPEVTLVAAVALAETLREAGGPANIKWPNDLLINDRKLAGILTELSTDAERVHFVILGIGVNLNSDQGDFPKEMSETATSLKVVRSSTVPRALFAAALLMRLEHWLDVWVDEGFAPVRQAWKACSSTLGQEVLVRSEGRELRGVAEDIDETGALLVRVGERVERVLAGDVEEVRSRRGT